MTVKTETALIKEGVQKPELPPFIVEGKQYIFSNKKNTLWETIQGLGAGWGLAVAVGTILELFIDLQKPKNAPDRFKNLVLSDKNWRQGLDAAGMATGAAIMATKAIKHNKNIDSYESMIKAERDQQVNTPQQSK